MHQFYLKKLSLLDTKKRFPILRKKNTKNQKRVLLLQIYMIKIYMIYNRYKKNDEYIYISKKKTTKKNNEN